MANLVTSRQIVNEMLELKNKTKIISIDFLSERFRGMVTLCLLVSSADSLCKQLDPDRTRQDVGPDMDPNCLTLMVHLYLRKNFSKKDDFVKNQQSTKNMKNYAAGKYLKWFFPYYSPAANVEPQV